jgi:CheY-like chemotaxis protein
VVDDDPEDHFIMQEYFEEAGLGGAVVFRENGEEALEYLTSLAPADLPSLVVLDLNMPVMNGIQTLLAIKATPQFATIPVVVYSTSNNDHERQQCLTAGARDYFTKPFSLQDGTNMVQRFKQMLQDDVKQAS